MNPAGDTPAPQQAWREQVRVRADALEKLADWLAGPAPGDIEPFLTRARAAIGQTSKLPWARRAEMERALGELDAAAAALLGRASEVHVRGLLPAVQSHVAAHLPPANPERLLVEQLAKTPAVPINTVQRAALVSAFAAASEAARRENERLRSFRNIVLFTSLALLVFAAGLAYVGARQPAWIPLCFAPQTLEKVVCPTEETALPPTGSEDGTGNATGTVGTEVDDVIAQTARPQDVGLVMLLGLAAAAVTGAVALRRIRGTSTPFAVPGALLLLKLPTGALTAVLGLLLLGGGFVPGFSALDSAGQILAWSVVFGAAQQLVTGVVDRQAQTVLESAGTNPMTAEKE